ncbi:MAG TPA: polysaccharide pyruvyl transferase family protein, partial [Enterococcus sp.]|nr:polysaccharide pyruvyl transferase family protein [Enterococcus sp.]
MKKIGIMSMQRIYNYGSFLQAYGLKKLIEEIEVDSKIVFVDYTPGKPLIESENKSNKIIRNFQKLKEYNNVNTNIINKIKFFNHKRLFEKKFYPLLGINSERVSSKGLDTLIIGSDEVFNCVQSNANVGYSTDLFGRNSEAKKVISYAGSFGNTTYTKLVSQNLVKELKDDFSRFESVSVRDRNSLNIVEQLGVKNPHLNIDPVLAYDYMNKEKQIPQNRLFKSKYIIVYGYSGRIQPKENAAIKKFAKNNGFKILCFGGVQDCCDYFRSEE